LAEVLQLQTYGHAMRRNRWEVLLHSECHDIPGITHICWSLGWPTGVDSRIISKTTSPSSMYALSNYMGRAIAQAVSRWIPIAAVRVRARVCSCGICGGQSGARAGCLPVLRFPLPIFIPRIAPQSPSSIIWGWYNRPVVAAVPSGLSLTLLTRIKKISIFSYELATYLNIKITLET
jgi:hypothetical protein